MRRIKSCPKCHGDELLETGGDFDNVVSWACLQCGHRDYESPDQAGDMLAVGGKRRGRPPREADDAWFIKPCVSSAMIVLAYT